ncbi:MAG TPA: AMP-binding protein [Mycobacteriales bacterium]|jgi:fatty-acyl-CoA synthase|nr:AMP-binding protein [Mycobacteriales bacterium]
MATATDLPADLHRQVFMPDLLVAALARHADKPAVYLGDTVLTASEVAAEMSRYLQAYASLGIGEHHPIAMLSKNRPEVLFTMGANMLNPCRSTSLHPMGSVDDQAYVLEDAGVETLVYDPSAFDERAGELRDRVPGLKTLLSLGPSENGTDLIELAKSFTPKPLRAPTVDPEDVSGLTYTGGTTGKSKGVMQTYRSGATLCQIQMAEWEWPEETRFLISTPLSHAGAAFFVPTLLRGGSIVVLPGFEPTAVLEAIQKYKITATMLVPTMLYILLDHPKLADYDLSSLETVYYGASAMSPTRLKEAIGKFGSIFFQFFGQSECGMTIAVLKKEEHDTSDMARLATCGRPTPWLKVALLDDDLNEVPDGDPGEICVRGSLVMKGYWNKPEQTEEALKGGWLHTGDIARKDADGFLTIVDRKKDMIVSGGFNVFPREIEDVIGTHPGVAQVAVIGVPDEKWGEAVKAVVVRRPDATVEADELITLVKERKGAVHQPKSVDFVDAIPLSALGKPDKKALRAHYWQGSDRQVG